MKRNKINSDIKKSSRYYKAQENEEIRMSLLDFFTAEQREILLKNGRKENHAKNHVPEAYLRIKKLGFRYLITELHPVMPEFAFGLIQERSEPTIGYFSLVEKIRSAKDEEDSLENELDFVGHYPLAVYALVSTNIGVIATDDSKEGYGEDFKFFGQGEHKDLNRDLVYLTNKLPMDLRFAI